ncbi:hypothetical protein VNI00_004834 [Paramarasmius palmivorus]|uniref:Uncharacterized protein n=1 Tax=Paramarasmius palmivorus TaxID=297713 RepID=A0AAW0DF42_9AGAR
MSQSGRPDIVFEAPPSAASSSPWTRRYSDFDPYHPDSYIPYTTNSLSNRDSEIPLLPQRTPEDEQFLHEPSTPRLLKKSSSRKGPVPRFLSVHALKYHDSQRNVEPFNPSQYQALRDRSSPETGATDDSFLKTPSPSLFPKGFGAPARVSSHRLQRVQRGLPGFERPEWGKILLHIGLCVAAFPVLLLFVFIARNRNLFWCRAIVGIGCGLIGVSLGLSLVQLGKRFLEAATWATLIHQSNVPRDAPGIRLRDLSSTVEEPTSMWAGLRLMWARYMYTGTARRARKAYDKRPWTLVILFFLASSTLASVLPFILSRIVDIETRIVHTGRQGSYNEVRVKGDLSPQDIQKADKLRDVFETFQLTWTLSPFSSFGNLPPVITLQDSEGEDVYFAEATRSQFLPGGSGFGTFEQESTAPTTDTSSNSGNLPNITAVTETDPGSLLRFPRWGIRIHCMKLSDPTNHIIQRTPGAEGLTYVFPPKDDIRQLYSSFNMNYPSTIFDVPFDTTILRDNVTAALPSGLDLNTTTHWLSVGFSDNGVAHSFKGFPPSMGEDGNGFIQLEMLLVRLNTTHTPNGTFPVYSEQSIPTATEQATFIGYDAAICLELFEPYIVEVYNSTSGLPSSTRIVSKGPKLVADKDSETGQVVSFRKGDPVDDSNVKRSLNSTGLTNVYIALHGNTINQILKDNGRDFNYVPSPTLVSYTGNSDPDGYTELSPEFFAKAKAKADSANVLTYLAGSADTLAWSFPDQVRASARVNNTLVLSLLGVILAMGLIAGLFVPKLPMQVPRRGFTLYSWLLAFQGTELTPDRTPMLHKHMHLEDAEREIGDLKFRYNSL